MNYPTQEELDQMWYEAFYGIAEGRQQVEEFSRMVIDWHIAQLAKQEPECWYGGNKFYADEMSAVCDCADAANLRPLYAATMPAQALCVDEGCPNFGTDHVCISHAQVPEGWKLVPVEPTATMIYMMIRATDTLERIDSYKAMLAAPTPSNAAIEDAKDAARLDFLDENLRMRMGWSVGKAPAVNISIQSIIQPSGATPIREAIDVAIDALKGGK